MDQSVKMRIDAVTLMGVLALPEKAKRVVLFAHGSGSSRLSPRSTHGATVLPETGVGTLLFDLIASEEDRVYERLFGREAAGSGLQCCNLSKASANYASLHS